MSEQAIPVLSREILVLRGRQWGRPLRSGDHPLEVPRLIGARHNRHGHRQALYLSVENPVRRFARGFIVDDRDGFGGENTLAAIMKHSGGWPWQPVAGDAQSTQSASGAPSSADPHSRAHN